MIVLFLVLTAAEYAVLSNGFRLAAERHEIQGSVVRLYNKDGGYTEIDAALVESIEREQNAPGPAPPPRPAAPPPARGTDELIDAAARRNGLPPQFVHSVVAAESAYRPGAVSPKGAVGLMQLMPATAKHYGVDPRDPAQNIEAGAAHLRELLLKYDGDAQRALAAYNAGPGAVHKYNGVPPYAETQTYVNRVLNKYKKAME